MVMKVPGVAVPGANVPPATVRLVTVPEPVKVPPEAAFDAEEISFNSFPRKIYLWENVSNVVLKDGLLTIDLKDNTLIQKQVNDEVEKEIEQEFNGFCQEQLVLSSRL